MSALDGKTGSGSLPLVERVPPHAFFVGSAIFHYLGPSFAVLLFARVPVAGVAWLRIVSAALVFALWRRPWRAFLAAERPAQWTMLALGGVFATMNYCFYRAIAELPLGTVAAIEFAGPVALALAGARSRRNLAALLLTVGGVYLLTEVRFGGAPHAFLWAFANAVLFTFYIVLAHAVSRADPSTSPIDRLGASMIIAGVAISPLGFSAAAPALLDPVALGAGVVVGISSSVIPYVFDQLAMRRLPRSTYALFVALLPATAVIIGVIVLRQVPSALESVGVLLVAIGVALHRPPA
ncbi:EamA family transporter [Dyella amyloliquefaciens]|uniref:EamA family transporter n=1 Tax=Dyella amyloliquefaciens TaxID=1770545 RepID=UPI00102EC1B2|nr:EamA family transporter [Dyella amyloliquefaciens]